MERWLDDMQSDSFMHSIVKNIGEFSNSNENVIILRLVVVVVHYHFEIVYCAALAAESMTTPSLTKAGVKLQVCH